MRISKDDLQRAQIAKSLIEKDLSKHHTYQDLAHAVSMSVSKLQCSFKRITGKNLYEYLTIRRIDEAVYMLENTEYNIDYIAFKVGLNRTNLNKQFKKALNKSPRQCRLEQEQKDTTNMNYSI
ncbi:helix-turn-helix domain-containing protein [Longitalea luteola]|uniref:helix-turn-helix domain-containing protein n=1 Tax=Longitalea luteola TaxID=2812563 RepID=UPI001A966CAE